MDRFKREAQVSAQLKHPNIVTIYDVGEVDGTSYLAMEFIDGVGLDRAIAGAGRLTIERAAVLGAQVADALDFAHRHNVVHRDIKPANIMIEGGDRVKVTDFGIAKVTDSADHLTQTGSLLGTPSYMSPEQARGSELDGRSDLFAVGCILYEMLTGKKAFRGDSITGLIFKIITEEPPPLRAEDPDIPEEMVRIISKCLAKQAGPALPDRARAGRRPPGAEPAGLVAHAAADRGGHRPRLLAAADRAAAHDRVRPHRRRHRPDPADHARARRGQGRPAAPLPAAPRTTPPRPAARRGRARRAAAPAKSKTGVIVGAVAAGLLVMAGAAGVAGWYFLVRKPATVGGRGPRHDATPPPVAVTAPPATSAPAPAAHASRSGAARPPPRPGRPPPRRPRPVPLPPCARQPRPAPPQRRGRGRLRARARPEPPCPRRRDPRPTPDRPIPCWTRSRRRGRRPRGGRGARGEVPQPERRRLQRLRGHGPLPAAGEEPPRPHALRAAGGGHPPPPHRQAGGLPPPGRPLCHLRGPRAVGPLPGRAQPDPHLPAARATGST